MRRLGQFISGQVRLQITGRHAERFFQLCVRNNIEIRDLECTGTDCFICTMPRKDVWNSRPYYRKTGVRCRILRKMGLPFFLFRYRRRILFPAVLCMVIYLFGYCSRFIWRVEISGNTCLTDEYLLTYLEEMNASPGSKKSDIDCNALVLALREDFDEIIWASAAVEGTVLQIQLQEKSAEEQPDEEQPVSAVIEDTELSESDKTDSSVLVASKDAIVESVITRQGLAAVKAGDVVSAGDVLVEGMQEVLDDDGTTKFWYITEPDADIIGIVTYYYTDSISENVTEKNFGDAFVSSIYIQLSDRRFSMDLPVSTDENTEQLENYYQLRITSQFYLPFGIGIVRSIPVTESDMILTKEEALESANSRLRKFITDLEEDGTEILEHDITMTKEDGIYKVEGVITAQESIGVLSVQSGMEGNQENDGRDN